MKVIFKIEDDLTHCSYENCKNNSAVYYSFDGRKKHLCGKHFNDEIDVLNEQSIETNVDEINNYFSKVKKQKNRPKNSCLNLADFNDYSRYSK